MIILSRGFNTLFRKYDDAYLIITRPAAIVLPLFFNWDPQGGKERDEGRNKTNFFIFINF